VNIPVLLEPTATGFRASTGAPLNLSAEASTADLALAAVRLRLAAKVAAGSRLVSIEEATARLTQAWDRLANDPQRNQFLDAMEAHRKERDAEDDPPGSNEARP
jgi:hypothetical protein